MRLSVDYKKSRVKVNEIVFKEDHAIITLEDGTKDLHPYKWLGKHRIVVTN